MDERRASITAWVNAYVRAYHALYDPPVIFDDSIARNFFTGDEFAEMGVQLASSLHFFDPERAAACKDTASALAIVIQERSGPIPISRARYTEDELTRSVARGAAQYMILGAGMDTFAFRRPAALHDLPVFEVDRASTQTFKRERLTARDWQMPQHLHFVPCDFNRESLGAALEPFPFDRRVQTFVSWLGVTYYLERERVLDMLRQIAGIVPKGSSIVFDYLHGDAFSSDAPPRVKRMLEIVERVGEPMVSGFDPETLATDLANAGWHLVENLRPVDIDERYFRSRNDNYRAFEHVHFAHAVTR